MISSRLPKIIIKKKTVSHTEGTPWFRCGRVFFPFLLIGWISCRRYCRQCCRRCCRCCCFNRITKSNLRPFCRCWRGNFLAVGSGYCFYGRLQRSYPRRKKTATSLRVHLFRSLFHVQKCVVFLLELKQLRQTGIHQTIR